MKTRDHFANIYQGERTKGQKPRSSGGSEENSAWVKQKEGTTRVLAVGSEIDGQDQTDAIEAVPAAVGRRV